VRVNGREEGKTRRDGKKMGGKKMKTKRFNMRQLRERRNAEF
jgi:hypothetical protein